MYHFFNYLKPQNSIFYLKKIEQFLIKGIIFMEFANISFFSSFSASPLYTILSVSVVPQTYRGLYPSLLHLVHSHSFFRHISNVASRHPQVLILLLCKELDPGPEESALPEESDRQILRPHFDTCT